MAVVQEAFYIPDDIAKEGSLSKTLYWQYLKFMVFNQ